MKVFSRFSRICIFSAWFFCVCLANAALAAPAANQTANGPIHVEADRMESDQLNGAVLFVGNVEARQGDMLISAERMTVHYSKNGAAGDEPGQKNKSIESLVAEGKVKITRWDWVASGDWLEFKSDERKVVLTGDTKVWQDNNLVTGDRVVLYLDEGKSVVEKGDRQDGERVKAFFYPEADNNKINNN
jgi:lipopolysaccharide export system protein LptA